MVRIIDDLRYFFAKVMLGCRWRCKFDVRTGHVSTKLESTSILKLM